MRLQWKLLVCLSRMYTCRQLRLAECSSVLVELGALSPVAHLRQSLELVFQKPWTVLLPDDLLSSQSPDLHFQFNTYKQVNTSLRYQEQRCSVLKANICP